MMTVYNGGGEGGELMSDSQFSLQRQMKGRGLD